MKILTTNGHQPSSYSAAKVITALEDAQRRSRKLVTELSKQETEPDQSLPIVQRKRWSAWNMFVVLIGFGALGPVTVMTASEYGSWHLVNVMAAVFLAASIIGMLIGLVLLQRGGKEEQ